MSSVQRAAAAAAARRNANHSDSSFRRGRRGSVTEHALRLYTGNCGFIRAGALKEGFLDKWGATRDRAESLTGLGLRAALTSMVCGAPKRRFFVLRPTALLYYFESDDDDASPLGAVDLDLYADTAVVGGQASPHRDAARPFRFTLSAPSDVSARRYELAAASERELQKWVGEIASARPSAIEQAMVAAAEATMGMQDRHAEETDELCAQVAGAQQKAAETSVVVGRLQAELAAWRRDQRFRQRQQISALSSVTLTEDSSEDGDGGAFEDHLDDDGEPEPLLPADLSFQQTAVNALGLIKEIRAACQRTEAAANARCATHAARADALAADLASAQEASAQLVQQELDKLALAQNRANLSEHVEKDILAQKCEAQAQEIAKLKAQKRTLKHAVRSMQAMYTEPPPGNAQAAPRKHASDGAVPSRGSKGKKKNAWLFRA